ncbi:MAG: phenylalanine--tRNA ligase subunit alpha [Kiritimatiellaeota bacterium]|nr:phenylalanine--tRNA ligase subunit alpha [Kiritimatiellota bacterium]
MLKEIDEILTRATASFQAASDEAAIEALRVEFLGRKSPLQTLASQMRELSPEERPAAGKSLNSAKARINDLLKEALANLTNKNIGANTFLDVTLPGREPGVGTKHPVSLVIDECVAIFRRLGFIVAEGPEIETVRNNFDALNTPVDHPSRDPLDTFYFSDGRLLRTQTSPVQIRVMESSEPPIRIVAPGRCFRRDTPDATHSMNFHQIEGLYIDEQVSLAELKSVLLAFARELFGPEVSIRMRPHFFPFTEPSVEYDFSCIMCKGQGCPICKNSGWLEIAGAGMVDPEVLANVGYDPEKWSGYAFGMGIERIAMIKYRINDIRLLYENDLRFLKQF